MYITNLTFWLYEKHMVGKKKKKGSIFHKPVKFVGYTQTHILVDISEHPTEVEVLLFNLELSFSFLSSHFFTFFVHATCTIELNSMGERISSCIHRL